MAKTAPAEQQEAWISDEQRNAMEMADLDEKTARHNRRAYEMLERQEKNAIVSDKVAD